MNEEDKKYLYDKAVEGRAQHLQLFNHWMNMYAIFNGALFVGYYSLCDKNQHMLEIIIIALGVISGWCWYFSTRGFYRWIISWINVVKMHEKLALNNKSVYRAFIYTNSEEGRYKTKPFSTQKITKCFSLSVAIAWSLLFLYRGILFFIIFKRKCWLEDCKVFCIVVYLVLLVIIVGFLIFLGIKFGRETDLRKTHYLYKSIGKDGFLEEWEYNEIILLSLLCMANRILTGLGFSCKQNTEIGKIQTIKGYFLNREYRYTGNFYTKGSLTIWVGFCDDYGYCMALCGQDDDRVEEVLVNSGIRPVVDYNGFDRHNWYTIVLEDEQINTENCNSKFASLFDNIKNIVDLINK